MSTSVYTRADSTPVVVQREYSKRGTVYTYGNIYEGLLEILAEDPESLIKKLHETIKKLDYSEESAEKGEYPTDMLTWSYLEDIIRPYFEEIWQYAMSSYKVAVGDSQFFRYRTKQNKPTAFAYSAETDIDKICSLASEYIRHFEFGTGDDSSMDVVVEILNEFTEKRVYTYENIQEVVGAFKNVLLFGLVWLHVKYDPETSSFIITHLLPSSIMFSNVGRVTNENIDWLVHEDLMSRQSVLHTFCPVLLEDDIDVPTKEKNAKVKKEIEEALILTSWDGRYCTPKNLSTLDEKRENPANHKLYCVIYKYYRYFKKKSKTYIYLKRVFINRKEIESLREYVDYLPYIPFIIADAYEHTFNQPHRRFQSIVTRAESEIMLISFLLSSAASKSANEISSLVMIDKKLLSNQSLNMEDLQTKTVVEVESDDNQSKIQDNVYTFESTNPANYGVGEIDNIHNLISFKFNAIINKDSIFKSGVHYSSVANHQMKVASTTLNIIDVTMVSLHNIARKVIKQTLKHNPRAVLTRQVIDRIKEMRNTKDTKSEGFAGLNIRQMANYVLRVMDSLHFMPTESSADASKKKSDAEKLMELNNASMNLKLPTSQLLKAMGLTGELYESMRKLEKTQEEIQALQHQLAVERALSEIEEIRAKTLEHKAKALKLKAEVSEIGASIKEEPDDKESIGSAQSKKDSKSSTKKTNRL